ncbi:MAG TPA: pyridoxal-phosphate dependent enzyme [Gemmatimonadales bacterium]|nr:pyridoxal-phosphate dependent enzyme [Gemmatimonadales bacterium]
MTVGPSASDIRGAVAALEGVAVRTPLVSAPALSAAAGVPVRLKAEHRQPIGAFKIRGAFTALARLDPALRARGVLTHSSGNHGQAIAFAARHFGIRAVIVMPDDSPKVKVAGVRSHGGEVVFCSRPERVRVAAEIAAREGLTQVAPYDHEDVILGQATCAWEILEDAPDTAVLVVPVGGGGLLAGCAAAIRASGLPVRLVAVEPEGAWKVGPAIAAGHPVPVAAPTSIADGLLPAAVGTLTFPIFRDVVAASVTVTEEEIVRAVRVLAAMGERVEPSGAVTSAAILAGRVPADGPIVAIVSGGNVDADVYERLTA